MKFLIQAQHVDPLALLKLKKIYNFRKQFETKKILKPVGKIPPNLIQKSKRPHIAETTWGPDI
jgi:hypothetical protein